MIRALSLLALAVPALLLAGCASAPQPGERTTLRPFRDEAELAEFNRGVELRRLAYERRRQAEAERRAGQERPEPPTDELPPHFNASYWMLYQELHKPPPTPPGVMQIPRFALSPMSRRPHYAGGDERPIAQVRGDELILLRRGRLFTAQLGTDALRTLSVVDAFGVAREEVGAYDEVLVSGNHVVVIGHTGRVGTELVLFRRTAEGALAHRATYAVYPVDNELESHTYAARVIDGRLVFYAPMPTYPDNPSTHLPTLRRLGGVSEITASAARVYRLADGDLLPSREVLHTVMSCDLEDPGMRCRSTAVYAPEARVYHVSPTAVYAWVPPLEERPAVLYRLPLDGTAPTALQVPGEPVDASSFLESGGVLKVLLQGSPRPEEPGLTGPLQLLQVPLSEFRDGRREAAPSAYRALPLHGPRILLSRWVNGWLLYSADGPPALHGEPVTIIHAVSPAGDVSEIHLLYRVTRIEPMGSGAVVAGTGGGAYVTGLRLGPERAATVQSLTIPGDSSPGLFYRPDGGDSGILAIPFRRPGVTGLEAGLRGADGIRFVRTRDLWFEELGDLAGSLAEGDFCMTSCFDWYRDTRPLFVDGRIYALLGGEVVEAGEEAGRIREVRRVRFAPPPPTQAIAGSWVLEETTIGAPTGLTCGHRKRGTMVLDRDGDQLSVRYRHGGCGFGGAGPTDVERTGRGIVSGVGFEFQVERCHFRGGMASPGKLGGGFDCRIPGPDGTPREVNGQWEARRGP